MQSISDKSVVVVEDHESMAEMTADALRLHLHLNLDSAVESLVFHGKC